MNLTLNANAFKNVLDNGTLQELEDILTNGAMPDLPYPELHNNTAIHLASYNKWPDKLKILLNSLKGEPERLKKALEAINDYGVTPLFEAIWVGRPPYDFKKTNPSEEKLKMFEKAFYMRMENMPRTVQILLDAGASIDNAQEGYPGGKDEPSYTAIEWLKEQLRWQEKIPVEKDSKVEKALKESLKIINQHSQKSILKLKDNQGTL